MSTILSIWTVVVFIVFLAIVFWAWNSHNKAAFEEAARIPLDDEKVPDKDPVKENNRHG